MFNRSYNKDVLSRASITIQIIEDIAIYKGQLFSSNGNIFGTGDLTSDIYIKVFKGLDDITVKFTDIVWKRFSSDSGNIVEDLDWGEQHKGKNNIVLHRDEVNEKANIQCEVYGLINGERSLVAADFITFIDINDMQGSTTPPNNPKHGDLWLDTSITPPRLMMWDSNLGLWVEVAIAGKDRRNLIRNSNFYRKNTDFWLAINKPTLEIESMAGKRWVRIKQLTATNNYCGISQIVKAVPKASYSFQMLSEIYIQSAAPNGNAVVAFFSIDDANNKTLIKEEVFDITTTSKVYTTIFTSLIATKEIEVIISGVEATTFDFVVTDTKLENHKVPTPWELAIEDIQDSLNMKVGNTHEEIFDSLTDEGKMQGIYVDLDEHGEKNFYFNASYIKTGKLLAQYIEARNLLVTSDDGIDTFNISNKGEVSIKAKKLQIIVNDSTGQSEDVATENDIAWKVDISSSNGLLFKNGYLETQLVAMVFKGKEDYTTKINASKFRWLRTSNDPLDDERWNNQYGKGVKLINLTEHDVYQKATFKCEVTE